MAHTAAMRARSVDELIRAIEGGDTPKYVFFLGHTGAIERACFSQWFDAAFVVDGVRYATAEHWMMAEKARVFGDLGARARILEAKTPGEAKQIGREVRAFDDVVWARERSEIVVRGNEAKFGQNTEIGAILRATAGRVLAEASPRDRIWGIGLGAGNERSASPREWRGLNLLGFALMEARARLFDDRVGA